MRPLSLVLFLVIVSSQAAVSGQTTRAEIIEKQRADKAATLATYKPGKIEKILLNAEDGKLKRLVAPHNGFFVGLRLHLQAHRRRLRAWRRVPARSVRSTRAGRLRGRSILSQLQHGQGRLLPAAAGSREAGSGRRRHLPPSAARRLLRSWTGFDATQDRVSYLYKDTEFNGRAIVTLRPLVQLRHACRARRSRHRLRNRRHDSIDRNSCSTMRRRRD